MTHFPGKRRASIKIVGVFVWTPLLYFIEMADFRDFLGYGKKEILSEVRLWFEMVSLQRKTQSGFFAGTGGFCQLQSWVAERSQLCSQWFCQRSIHRKPSYLSNSRLSRAIS